MLQPAKPSRGARIFGYVVVSALALCIVGVVIGVVAHIVNAGGKPSSSDRGLEATAMCETFVKQQLKAPATAKFSQESPAKVSDAEYTVGGSVDSQNSFGALLRSTFTCDLTVDSSNTWTSKSVSVVPTS